MSYHKKYDAKEFLYTPMAENLCFACRRPFIEGQPVITYDGWVDKDHMRALLLHGSCASAMAQRLIIDAWPNRYSWTGELVSFRT